MEIGRLLKVIEQRGLFQTIQRLKYMPFDMNIALNVVEAIGKHRNPQFVIDNKNRFTYENIIRWIHGDETMKCIDPVTKKTIPGRLNAGLYIAGNTGSGKSWCLEIMAAYCLIDNVQITLGENTRCLIWDNIRTDAVCDEFVKTGECQNYKTKSIIGFQDLGSEPIESLYMGNRINVMRQILEYRGDRTDLITLITSNLPMGNEVLIDRYDDRVSSRLNEMCNYFEIKGKDRRK